MMASPAIEPPPWTLFPDTPLWSPPRRFLGYIAPGEEHQTVFEQIQQLKSTR
jgi:hypothetical protein